LQDRVVARVPTSGQQYAGRMMSDGERVAFYLLGQVLCAPSGAIIVIDEPEIHLHRAIQAPLWDAAEASRTDCTFAYVTHDLEFAATRSGARKVWAKSYDGVHWEWEEVESSAELPDELVLRVLGNRHPAFFVEGDENSFDSALYRVMYPDRLIVPMASCHRVIGARRGMEQLGHLHNLNIEGVVDRDHRSDEEIGALRGRGIRVAEVAEVENLFCVPAALSAVAEQLKVANPIEVVERAKARVLSELQKGVDAQVAARAIAEIQFRLNGFGPKARTSDADTIESELTKHFASIDVASVFKRSRDLFATVIANDDYESSLRFYNCKGIPSFIASAFGVSAATYCNMVVGIVRSAEGAKLASDLRSRIS
jgi:hypothetical protein